jgi:hypothetical protein
MRTCLANKIISGRRHFSKVISDIFIVLSYQFFFYFCLESVTVANLRAFFSGDKIMVFGPPDKIVLISWVEHPLQLPDHEREALEQYGIEWREINWQLKELLGCKYHQVDGEMVRFYG